MRAVLDLVSPLRFGGGRALTQLSMQCVGSFVVWNIVMVRRVKLRYMLVPAVSILGSAAWMAAVFGAQAKLWQMLWAMVLTVRLSGWLLYVSALVNVCITGFSLISLDGTRQRVCLSGLMAGLEVRLVVVLVIA